MTNSNDKLDFSGQNIYVGIDVHKNSWSVTILTENVHHKTFSQPPSPSLLVAYLQKKFPRAIYYSAYEAGFSGLCTHFELTKMGVNNLVVNPADIPSTQKEQLQKTDAIDSRKIARSLRSGQLSGIYIPEIQTLEARSLLRTRNTLVKDLSRMKVRIKSMLYYYGVEYPNIFEKSTTHWSNKFMKWLSEDVSFTTTQGKDALFLLVKSATELRKLLLEATLLIKLLSQTEKYAESLRLIRTIPGIGLITGMTFLTEIEDITRFSNSDKLAGYIGLIPTSHASGEKEGKGEMTFRGQVHLKSMLIESSWFAIRNEPVLILSYSRLVHRMQPNKAITRIARKLLNRIFSVLKYKKEYVQFIQQN